jgi:hypothetical protein
MRGLEALRGNPSLLATGYRLRARRELGAMARIRARLGNVGHAHIACVTQMDATSILGVTDLLHDRQGKGNLAPAVFLRKIHLVVVRPRIGKRISSGDTRKHPKTGQAQRQAACYQLALRPYSKHLPVPPSWNLTPVQHTPGGERWAFSS